MTIDEIKQWLASAGTSRANRHEDVSEALKLLKQEAVSAKNQNLAKQIWCYEEINKIQELFEKAFYQLKNGEHEKAWGTLVNIEYAIGYLVLHISTTGEDEYRISLIDEYVKELQSFFPYVMFISPEFVGVKRYCSICDKRITPHDPCGHEAGEVYDGMMCYRNIRDIKVAGTALVTNPVDKRSIVIPPKADYRIVDYIIKHLITPYSEWSYKKSVIRKGIKGGFKNVGRNEPCPCGSGKKFKKCHAESSELLRGHIQFHFKDAIIDPDEPSLEIDF